MAKRRTNRAIAQAAKRLAMAESRGESRKEGSGKSHYALKRKGQRQPGPAQSRPSWFVRQGWAALAERHGFRGDSRGFARADSEDFTDKQKVAA